MKQLLAIVLVALAGCARFAARPEPPPVADLALTHVAVVDVETGELLEDRTVLVADGRIREVVPTDPSRAPAAVRVVSGRGKFLIPGLWDAHVHLSFMGADVLPLFVANGITSVRDVGSRLDEVAGMRRRIEEREIVGPRIATSGPVLEGEAWMQAAYQIMPRGHPIWAAAPRVVVSASSVRHVVDSLKALGVDLVKSRNVWGADFLALADATQEAGLPLASHNPNRVSMVDAARHGLDSFEHAESIWGDFDSLTVEARDAMFAEVARTTAMVTPTLMADIGLVVSSDSAILAIVTDTMGRRDARNLSLPPKMRNGWMEAMESRRKYGAHPPGTFAKITRDVQAMHRAGIAMMAGTDAGGIPLVFPGTSLHEELELLVRDGGLTPLAALQSATRNPPRFFGRSQELGTVAAGRVADLVLLDANPLLDIRNTRKVAGVVLDGRWLDRDALHDQIEKVEKAVARERDR